MFKRTHKNKGEQETEKKKKKEKKRNKGSKVGIDPTATDRSLLLRVNGSGSAQAPLCARNHSPDTLHGVSCDRTRAIWACGVGRGTKIGFGEVM